MDSTDLLKQYRARAALRAVQQNPLEHLLELEDHIERVTQETYKWYLERDTFAARRLVQEVRNIRESLLEFQLVLEGIAVMDGEKPEEVDLRDS